MKRFLAYTLVLSSISMSTTSCRKSNFMCIRAHGDVVKETRTVEDFNSVEFNLSGDVYLYQDTTLSAPKVIVETNENILERIRTDVEGNTLVIKDKGCISRMKDLRVYITVADLRSVHLNGSGNIHADENFRLDELKMHINGSGDIDYSGKTNDLTLDINGSGNITASGTTHVLDVIINGSGEILARQLKAGDCMVDINGSGDCEVNVSGTLDVTISGSGNVYYTGTPTSVNLSGSGSGNVSRL